jgi:DNA polymerase-3 subunit alpha
MSLKITSFKKIGKKKVYNLSMKGEDHNYFLDQGIVSANSHSVAYSVISYQTAWLKTYYPHEFHVALMNSSFKDQDDLVKYIYACKEEEIPIVPPDVNESSSTFTLNEGTIVFGLAGIKGLGKKACESLVEEKETNGKFTSLQNMIERKINKGTLKALAACGALEEISEIPRDQLVENLEELIKYHNKLKKWAERNERIAEREKEIQAWNADPKGTKPRKLPKNKEKPEAPKIEESSATLSRSERLSLERQTLGFYITGHPMDDYPGLSLAAKYNVAELREGKKDGKDICDGEPVAIPVVISSISIIRTKRNQNMAIIKAEDKSGRIESIVWPKQWKKLQHYIQEDTVCMVHGSVRVTEAETEDAAPIVKLSIFDIKVVDDIKRVEILPVEITTQDGTKISFTPKPHNNYAMYQQALAIAKNIKRMG